MAWIDDRIWCHEKFTDLTGNAFATYVKGIAYSSGFATAGHLTPGQIKLVGGGAKETKALLAAGLWEQNGHGINIHDWDEHNGKRDARRLAERDRKRATRKPKVSAGQGAGHPPGRGAGPECVDLRAPDDSTDGSDGSEGSKRTSKPKPSRPSSSAEDVQRVYDHWRSLRGKARSNYATISVNRRKKIQARLNEFSADELCSAIEGVARDPWADRAQHDDLTIVFRNREQVERFLEMPANGAAGKSKLSPYDAAKAWVLATGWRFPDEDLLDELGRRGLEGEQKTRLAEIAYSLQKGGNE